MAKKSHFSNKTARLLRMAGGAGYTHWFRMRRFAGPAYRVTAGLSAITNEWRVW
jgi:hypothetical protein